MSRRLKAKTHEMGLIELYLIYDEGGEWEDHWRPLQEMPEIVSLLPSIPREEMEAALIGWSKPLVTALGPSPKGALLKLPETSRICWSRTTCPFHRKETCGHLLPRMPWCFVPDGFEDDTVRRLVAEIIGLWREGVYVIRVQEPLDA